MPTSVIQRSFAAGEIGPALYGRADLAAFQTGLRTCRNFMVMRSGGVTNRPGHPFVGEVKNSSLRTYFTKFVFNAEQTYLIEMGDQYFRFYREAGQILVSNAPAWSLIANYTPGNLVSLAGVNYVAIVANVGVQPPNAGVWYPLNGSIYEIPTPYVTADLATLQFVQSGDIVTITHANYAPRELVRSGHTAWVLRVITTAPALDPPANVVAVAGTAGALRYAYVVTAVQVETYKESIASNLSAVMASIPTASAPNTLSWDSVPGAIEYNVYLDKDGNGAYGFCGIAKQTSFNDIVFVPDFSVSPPVARTLFASENNYPSTATYYQQRLLFARTNNAPERIDGSRSGDFKNFTISSPIQDDDAITLTLAGRKVNEIRFLFEIGGSDLDRLVALTAGGEWTLRGDQDGVLRPTAINPHQASYCGAAPVPPAIIANRAIYIQARGNIVRDLYFEPSFASRDLTILSPHLFESDAIERMDYAQIPHSIVWMVRSDGTLLGLTYLPEQDIFGWHRHDTDGTYEDVCVIPEGDEDAIYVMVRRTIQGQTRRYIERFASRRVTEVQVDAKFLDSSLSYNGLNASANTMTLSSAGGGWTVNDEITVTATTAVFGAGGEGNAVDVWLPGVAVCRVVIGTYVSPSVIRGYPNKTVPQALRNVASTFWAYAVDQLAGLDHLEGKTVGILANGNVLAEQTVTNGQIVLDRPYAVIHAGLPIEADFETLDLDSVQTPLRDKKKLITSVSLLVESSRGIQAGPDADHLLEAKPKSITAYGEPIELVTDLIEVPVTSSWEETARVFIRQSDPLPLSILSILPNVDVGG